MATKGVTGTRRILQGKLPGMIRDTQAILDGGNYAASQTRLLEMQRECGALLERVFGLSTDMHTALQMAEGNFRQARNGAANGKNVLQELSRALRSLKRVQSLLNDSGKSAKAVVAAAKANGVKRVDENALDAWVERYSEIIQGYIDDPDSIYEKDLVKYGGALMSLSGEYSPPASGTIRSAATLVNRARGFFHNEYPINPNVPRTVLLLKQAVLMLNQA